MGPLCGPGFRGFGPPKAGWFRRFRGEKEKVLKIDRPIGRRVLRFDRPSA